VEVTTIHEKSMPTGEKTIELTAEIVPFLNLSLDVPPPPLFKDETEKNVIPQIPIFDLLTKFDGVTEKFYPPNIRKRFRLVKLPPYLVLHIKRFTKNNFVTEKNPTIVTSPLKHFDFTPYMKESSFKRGESVKYDLVANIVHEGEPGKGSYRAHIFQKATNQWFEMEDIVVKSIMPQLIALSESYIQIYETSQMKISH